MVGEPNYSSWKTTDLIIHGLDSNAVSHLDGEEMQDLIRELAERLADLLDV